MLQTHTPGAIAGRVFGVVTFAVWVVYVVLACGYLRRLALHLPSRKLRIRARYTTWRAPIIATVGVVVCGLGPIVALVLYSRVAWLLRQSIGRLPVPAGGPGAPAPA